MSYINSAGNISYLLGISFGIFLGFMIIFSDFGERVKKYIHANLYLFLMILMILATTGIYVLKPYLTPKNPVELPQIQEINTNILPPLDSQEEETPPVVKTFDISQFSENLALGSEGENVKNLQLFLNEKGYYNFSIDGIYAESTQIAMRRFLNEKCGWKQDNQGILGPLARECIKKMLIE